MDETKRILIIGASGGLAQILIKLLIKQTNLSIVAIDSRTLDHLKNSERVLYKQIPYTRGNFEKIFRTYNFEILYHLGRISHVSSNPLQTLRKRLTLNVLGTQFLLDLCLKNKVKKTIILSTFHVYGAFPENSIFLSEDSPLKASLRFPEIRDVVEMDRVATNFSWHFKGEIETVVLRPCNIIGPNLKNAMTTYLTSKYAPTPIDYRPMFQFISEFDMANILFRSYKEVPSGVYNVCPNEFISIQEAKKVIESPGIPVPIFMLSGLAKIIKKSFRPVPDYLIEYLKYSCLISNEAIKEHLGEDFCQHNIKDTLAHLR